MTVTKIAHKISILFLCVMLGAGLTGCAQNPHTGYKSGYMSDPIEPFNRAMFAVNDVLDTFIITPIAKIYHAIFPSFARDGVQNFMRNLRSPLIVANNLLQGNIGGAGVATARFVINTTAGIGGLVDVAATQGLPYAPEDFGQTLAVWGLGDGFYIVLPVLGPSSLRDTAGLAGDWYADPIRIWTHKTDNDWIYYTRAAVEGIDNRSRMLRATADMRRNSLDYYAAIRSAYAQKRAALIRNENPDALPDMTFDD